MRKTKEKKKKQLANRRGKRDGRESKERAGGTLEPLVFFFKIKTHKKGSAASYHYSSEERHGNKNVYETYDIPFFFFLSLFLSFLLFFSSRVTYL